MVEDLFFTASPNSDKDLITDYIITNSNSELFSE